MVDKEGTGGEKDAMKAYRAAREETDNTAEEAEGDEASAALIERVRIFKSKYYSLSLSLSLSFQFPGIRIIDSHNMTVTISCPLYISG
jgi:hypothetical protein